MKEWCHRLVETHPSVRAGRALGLFGCLDLQGPDGKYMQPLTGPMHPAVPAFKQALTDGGLFGLVRPPLMHHAPPLVISEAELRHGFEIVDNGLTVLDRGLGF
jgi:taurine--2-oxoglutarate transaminase